MNLELLNEIDSFVWGPPLLVLLVGTGVFLSLRLGFLQVARLPKALGLIFKAKSQGEGDTSSFRALCTALAATIGTGNIVGVARGVFSNESGLGSAPIVAAAAKTKWPAEQGLVSMTGTFIDTIIICTLTGLTLVVSGLWKGDLNGAALTQAAFMQGYPEAGKIVLMVGLVLFAFTTILGWNYYGERCIVYLAGVKAVLPYRIIFIVLVALGAFLKLEAIWVLADIVNGLMAIPNLIALLALSGVVVAETKRYFKHVEMGDVDEVNGLLPDGPEEVIEQKLEGR